MAVGPLTSLSSCTPSLCECLWFALIATARSSSRMRSVLNGDSDDKLQQLFWVMDTDASGTISADELFTFFQNMYRMKRVHKTSEQIHHAVAQIFAHVKKNAQYDQLDYERTSVAAVSAY